MTIMKTIQKIIQMKRLIIIIPVLITVLVISCRPDEQLVTYPKSYPTLDVAEVAEDMITYGDSITLNVTVSDKTPLSTLEVTVAVNNEVVTSESIRTKGKSATVSRRYRVPFVANRPDNERVKVYISSVNVDGWTTDTILSTTIAKRPVINELWLVPTIGKSYKMTLIDSANLIYYVEGMSYGTTITYRLATKVDKFFKVDFSGLVFGKVGDGVGVIDASGDPLTSTDETLVGISKFTFDALKFTVEVGGKLLEPVTTLDLNAELSPMVMASKNFLGGNVYFGEGVEVTFTGLTNLPNSLPPDYFEITGENTATFLGPTAIYKAYYYIDGAYLYVEPQPDVIYPEAMWVCGTGFGRPSAPYETTSSWNWNTPFDYAPCRLVSTGVYQLTIYGNNSDPEVDGYGTLDFKFFFKRGWWDAAHEIDAADYTLTPPFFGRTDTGNTGNVNGGSTSFEGVFRITLNMNDKTITLEKIN
jgi:hypothetical protein